MAVSYPTADRHPTLYQEPRASRGVFYGLPSMVRISEHRDRPFRLIVTAHFANA